MDNNDTLINSSNWDTMSKQQLEHQLGILQERVHVLDQVSLSSQQRRIMQSALHNGIDYITKKLDNSSSVTAHSSVRAIY